MYKIVDNFLNQQIFDQIKTFISSNEFPWFFQENISVVDNHENSNFLNFGFSHVFFKNGQINSTLFKLVEPVVEALSTETRCKYLLKARADLTVFSKEKYIHQIHKDLFEDHVTAILYFTNSSAETILYKNTSNHTSPEELNKYIESNKDSFNLLTTIVPKENRLVYFDGKLLHTGHSPSDRKNRILLNFNLI
jgi:hypothetical protein